MWNTFQRGELLIAKEKLSARGLDMSAKRGAS
jgi:hypothetical protein